MFIRVISLSLTVAYKQCYKKSLVMPWDCDHCFRVHRVLESPWIWRKKIQGPWKSL